MKAWVCLQCSIISILTSGVLSLSSYGEHQASGFAHIMDLYRGLLSHSYSDIVLAIDSAEGVKQGVFNETRSLSELAVKCLSHVKDTRIAIISFSDRVKTIHSFNDCQKDACIVQSLRRLSIQKGRRATARALKEAKKILKNGGQRRRKWTVVLVTFGAPRVGRKRTAVISQRLKRAGADMYVLGVGRRAFNNYVSLKSIVKPFETTKAKMLHRLFLFRGPQHKKDFVLTKAVLKVVCANGPTGLISKMFG